jgi:hypothetical protein
VVGYPNAGAVAKLLCERGLISERGRDRVEGGGKLVFGEGPDDPAGWWTPRAKIAD